MKKMVFSMLLIGLAQLVNAQIVITEIFYNNVLFDDSEFVEFYNNSGADIQMEGYTISDGLIFTFPNYVLPAGGYVVVTEDSLSLLEEFGVTGFQWEAGSLSSSGEDVSITGADNILIDSVDYKDGSDGWPALPDGLGYSLSLCDVDSDNVDPANWQATSSGPRRMNGHRYTFATPGEASICAIGPWVTCTRGQGFAIEGKDTVSYVFYLNNSNGMPTSVNLSVDASSTATADDYEILNSTVAFDGMQDTFAIVTIATKDDGDAEGRESLIFNITAGDNVERLLVDDFTMFIYDDDAAPTKSLVLAGIFGTNPVGYADDFGVELFALKDIPDLSVYSLGMANNGDGTDGIEIPLPAVSLGAGKVFFISDSNVRFKTFFERESDFAHPSSFITGNDAVELFENGTVIDVFGEIDFDDSTPFPWDYEDGWAVRLPDTGPDDSTFVLDNWLYSGIEALTGPTNETSPLPYSFGFYTNMSVSNPVIADKISLKIYPTVATDFVKIEFEESSDIDVQSISIFHISGALVERIVTTKFDDQYRVNVADLSSGYYVINVQTDAGAVAQKFIRY